MAILIYRLEVFFSNASAFDQVWHEEHTYKIKCLGVKGNLLILIESALLRR